MIISFDDLELDLDLYELRRGGAPVALEPQVFDVLAHLAQNPGRLIARTELLDAVWGDRFVSESALSSRIKAARRAVGDDGTRQRVIATVHGRGYRFVARARTAEPPEPDLPPLLEDIGLLERDAAIRPIETAMGAATSGSGHFVFLSGEAGIGKSAVVQQLSRRLGDRTPILVAGCDDLTTPRALGAVRDLVAQMPPAARAAVGAEPTVSELVDAWRTLADGGACLVVLEDLHWADDATLDVVRQLTRRVREAAVVLVVTYREEDLGLRHPLRGAIAAARGTHVTNIRLAPLSEEAVAELVGDADLDAIDVFTVTGGNPLFVTELIASPAAVLPTTVRDAVLGRLSLLDAAHLDVVRAVSIAPSRVERELVAALTGDSDSALIEAERIGLLAGDASHVWFRHELVRQAVEDTLASSERVRLHRAAARYVDGARNDPARVAHHAALGGDTELLVRAGPAAARAASKAHAHRQVVEHLAAVLNHTDLLVPAERAELLAMKTHSLYLLNRFSESLAVGEQAVALAEEIDDEELLARALLALGRTALWATGPRTARCAVERALAVLGPDGDLALRATAHADMARAVGELVTIGSVAQGHAVAVEHATEALRLADELSRPEVRGYALMYLGSEQLARGEAAGLAHLEEAVSILSAFPQTDIAVRACVNVSGACFRAGRFDEAERYVALGLQMAGGAEFFSGEYRLGLTRASTRLSRGRWREAREELTSLLAREGAPGIMEPLARSLLARILARQGEAAEAGEVLQPALRAVAECDEARVVGPVTISAVEVGWLASEPGDLATLAGRAFDLAASDGSTVVAAELASYLRLAGLPAPDIAGAPEPWATGLRGDWRASAAAWERRGEPYERALALAGGGPGAREESFAILAGLGATATITALSR